MGKVTVMTEQEFGYFPESWNIWQWMKDRVDGKITMPVPHGTAPHEQALWSAEKIIDSFERAFPDEECEIILVKRQGEPTMIFRQSHKRILARNGL